MPRFDGVNPYAVPCPLCEAKVREQCYRIARGAVTSARRDKAHSERVTAAIEAVTGRTTTPPAHGATR